MKVTCFVAAALMVGSSPAWAQDAAPQTRPPAPASQAQPDPKGDDIRTMEALLTQALQKGAQDLARLLRVNEPNSAFVTGTGRARGVALEGYGLFFYVDVPNMKYSVVWSAQMVQLTQDRDKWMQVVASRRPDDPLYRLAEGQLRQIDTLMTAAQRGAVLITKPDPNANTQMAPPDRVGAAVAIAENNRLADSSPVSPSALAASPLPAVAPPPEIRDPNDLYTESVKNALIDTMLRLSSFLKIGEQEWLTVAASDNSTPQPGQLDDSPRIMIRIKGSDLAAFQSGRISREEVMKKVEVREF